MFRLASLIALCIPLVSGLAVLAVQDTANAKDRKALQGKWEVVSFVDGGKEEKRKSGFVLFEEDKLRFSFSSESEPFTLDASKKPKTLTIKNKVGLSTNPGIYELKEDDLKLCFYHGPGDIRPTEFVSTQKNDQSLYALRRVKK